MKPIYAEIVDDDDPKSCPYAFETNQEDGICYFSSEERRINEVMKIYMYITSTGQLNYLEFENTELSLPHVLVSSGGITRMNPNTRLVLTATMLNTSDTEGWTSYWTVPPLIISLPKIRKGLILVHP